MFAKKGKFGNKICEYKGNTYQSKKEMFFAKELDLRLKAKDIRDWSRQIRIPLELNGKKICDYIVDFVVVYNDGTKEFIEIKGFMTQIASLKIKLFKAIYPNYKFTLIK